MTTDKYPKFLPQWTNAIEHICGEGIEEPNYTTMKRASIEFGLNWFSEECCLTGEAFFHEEKPDCITCHNFTYGHGRSQMALTKRSALYKYKKELAKHLIKVHPEVWSIWKEKMV